MKLFSARPSSKEGHSGVEEAVARIQKGDELLRSRFIEQYTNYIIGTAARIKGRHIEVENDEEFAAALIAFNRAIDRYDPGRGASFFSFASLLIKLEIYDLYSRSSGSCEVPLSQLNSRDEEDKEDGMPGEEAAAIENYRIEEDHFYLKQEIAIYTAMLKEYSLSFSELAKDSPRHRDTRHRMMAVAARLAEDKESAASIIKNKVLPVKKISEEEGLSRKTIERHRRFILANFILMLSDLDYLKEYIKDAMRGGDG